jgi:hypothetical protein
MYAELMVSLLNIAVNTSEPSANSKVRYTFNTFTEQWLSLNVIETTYNSASRKSCEVLTPLGTVCTAKLTMDGQNMKL